MMDSTGLIYLRARYYDPGISRFVQIDNNYDGEKESIASQNKYVYTLNNPYKYVDRNGNWAVGGLGIIPPYSTIPSNKKGIETTRIGGTTIGGAGLLVTPKKAKPIAVLPNIKKPTVKKEQPLPKIEPGIGKNKPSLKGGGSVTKKPEPRNIVISAKCPEKEEPSMASKALDVLQNVLDFIGWIPGLGDICDGINAAISFFRNDFIGAIISVTCIVFTVVADALLKPLKNSKTVQKVVEVIKDKFGAGVSKIADFVGSIAKKIKDVPFIGKLLDGATKALNKFKGYIDNLFNKGASGAKVKGKDIIFGSEAKSAEKLTNQITKRGWTKNLVMDTVDNPYTIRTSINRATGNSATVYYTKQGSYVIVDDVTKAVVQVGDNIHPSTWVPDSSIVDPYIPK